MIIFLDIDGVLNNHNKVVDHYCGIDTYNVKVFNKLIEALDAKIVVSSAWRYMILRGAMSLTGFSYLLKTHGVKGDLIGHTCSDEEVPERSGQISRWLEDNNYDDIYIVLDDLEISGHPQIRTDGNKGLTYNDLHLYLTSREDLCIKK